MIVSRGTSAIKCVLTRLKHPSTGHRVQPMRKSHDSVWSYRVPQPPQPKVIQILAEVVGGFTWWWIFWHLWHEPGHIVGEFEYPDPSKWTDEELGIPPDDEE